MTEAQDIVRRGFKSRDDRRIHLLCQFRPIKGSRRRSRTAAATLVGTDSAEKALQVVTALLQREAAAGKSIEQLHTELCNN